MKKVFRRTPSGALVVAVIALIAAASGTAIGDPGGGGADGTHGVFKMQGTPAGASATLFKEGPFKVTMTCTKNDSGTQLQLFASSSEANSVLTGQLVPTANTPVDLGNMDLGPGATGFQEATGIVWDLQSPRGHAAVMSGADGVNSLGADCWANWDGHAQ